MHNLSLEMRARVQALEERGAEVYDIGHVGVDEPPTVDLTGYDNDDGSITVVFDNIPGAYIFADDLPHAVSLLNTIAILIGDHIREEQSAEPLRSGSGASGFVGLGELKKRGVRSGRIEGKCCMGISGVRSAFIQCDTKEGLAQVLGILIHMGIRAYFATQALAQVSEVEQESIQGQDVVLRTTPIAPFKTND